MRFEKASNLDVAEEIGVEAPTDFLEPKIQHSVTGSLPISVIPRKTGVSAAQQSEPQALHDQSGCENAPELGFMLQIEELSKSKNRQVFISEAFSSMKLATGRDAKANARCHGFVSPDCHALTYFGDGGVHTPMIRVRIRHLQARHADFELIIPDRRSLSRQHKEQKTKSVFIA